MTQSFFNVSSNFDDQNCMPVFDLTPVQQVNRFVCCIVGIPLNLTVFAVILRSKQLWSPRNIYWLAVTFFNLLAVQQAVTELTLFHLYQEQDGSHEILCKIYSMIVGCPYNLLLTGLILASYDRYLALAHHRYYHDYVTAKYVSSILIADFFVIVGGHTSPYWLGIYQTKCDTQMEWLAVTLSFQGLFSSTCIIIQVCLFVIIRNFIRFSASNSNHPNEINLELERTNDQENASRPSDPNRMTENNSRICQLELRASRILGIGIIPFCLTIFVLFLSTLTFIICRWQDLNAFYVTKIMLMFRETLLFHLLYIPTVFIVLSREFRAAFKRFFRHRTSRIVRVQQLN